MARFSRNRKCTVCGVRLRVKKFGKSCSAQCAIIYANKILQKTPSLRVSAKNCAKKTFLSVEDKKKERTDFYQGQRWLELRWRVLKRYGRVCMSCGAGSNSGVEIHVDHIKPRSLYPELQYVEENLQVLCRDCNLGKRNSDECDLRPQAESVPVEKRVKTILRKKVVLDLPNPVAGELNE